MENIKKKGEYTQTHPGEQGLKTSKELLRVYTLVQNTN